MPELIRDRRSPTREGKLQGTVCLHPHLEQGQTPPVERNQGCGCRFFLSYRYNILHLNYGHNVTFNFDHTISWFNDYFAAHRKVNGSRSGGFLPDVYQTWDEIIWLTPEKGSLLSNAPICWEQIEPSPEASRQLNDNDWKQLRFLPQELCTTIIPVFSNPSSGPPFGLPRD